MKGTKQILMRIFPLSILIALHLVSYASDPKFPVSDIPEALKKMQTLFSGRMR
jgi:hypothetical protein